MKFLSLALLLALPLSSFATVTFVTSASDPAFASLPIFDDYSLVTPHNTGLTGFSSFGVNYTPVTADIGSWTGVSLAAVLGSTDIPNYLVTADGDEDMLASFTFNARRVGFETFTINEAGNPLSVSGAPNVVITVTTAAGPTVHSLVPGANNHGFLGIISDDPILSVHWYGQMGGIRDTGFTNMRVAEAVPEPMTLTALGLATAGFARRRSRKA